MEDIHVDIGQSESASISRSLMPVKYSALIIRVWQLQSVVTPVEWRHTYGSYTSTDGIYRIDVINFAVQYTSTLYFTTIVTRFFDEIEIFISLDASF